jgi:hypothetical protein
MDRETRDRKVQEHLEAIRELEATEAEQTTAAAWPPPGFYPLWHLVVGVMLGSIGSLVSLAGNAIGAPLFGEHPLQLIRVYLTFPMGARALEADQGLVLFAGCLLYLVTGALYGVAFHFVMTLYFADASRTTRFLFGSAM